MTCGVPCPVPKAVKAFGGCLLPLPVKARRLSKTCPRSSMTTGNPTSELPQQSWDHIARSFQPFFLLFSAKVIAKKHQSNIS